VVSSDAQSFSGLNSAHIVGIRGPVVTVLDYKRWNPSRLWMRQLKLLFAEF
jgi:hypothetical protein